VHDFGQGLERIGDSVAVRVDIDGVGLPVLPSAS
jgi:hypothetical protein